MKKFFIILIILGLGALAFYWYTNGRFFAKDVCPDGPDCAPTSPVTEQPKDDHEETFSIDNVTRATVVVMDGQKTVELSRTGTDRTLHAQFSMDDIPTPGSVALLEEQAIYQSGTGDIFIPSVANYGGSGSFVSIDLFSQEGNAAIIQKDSYALGDRVLVRKLMTEGSDAVYTLRVQFLDRKKDEPMAAEPTVLKELTVSVADHQFGMGNIQTLSSASPDTYKDMIVVDTPKKGESVSSPLTVRGKARGQWYFEGTFPVVVTDWDGKIIGEGYGEAKGGEWMTPEYVPFTGTISFTVPSDTSYRCCPLTGLFASLLSQKFSVSLAEASHASSPYRRGTIIFRKSNASDLREHDDAFEVPVVFQ
ncbi:Gmad2 immunoglobulin-like domain-containing protein [Candidatus Kaiserbacteria bacterium]|nr:Gmad2 immunoglobulin-like domain-containing protein [Candidatus Kaiserbacteria bacterium]